MKRATSSATASKANSGAAWKTCRKVLEAAGSDLAHVAQTRNYVRDAEDVALYNQLNREYFSDPESRPHQPSPTAFRRAFVLKSRQSL